MEEKKELIIEKIKIIREKLEIFQAKYIPIKEKIIKRSKEINSVIAQINSSWSGSPLEYHHNLYYKDFERPEPGKGFNIEWGGLIGIPEGWRKKEYKDVAKKVYKMAPGIQIEDIEELISPIVNEAKELSLEVVTSLSFIRHFENSEDEMELLRDIEPDKWKISYDSFLNSSISGDYYTRDSSAAIVGVKYPPHFCIKAQLESLVSPFYIIDKFIENVKRLTMQVNTNLPHYKEKTFDKKEGRDSGINIFNSNVGAIQTGNKAQIIKSNLLSDIKCDNSDIVVKLLEKLLSSIKNESKLSDFEKDEALNTVGEIVDELSIEKEKQNTSKTTFLFNKLNWILEKAPVIIDIVDKIREYIKLGNQVTPPGVG